MLDAVRTEVAKFIQIRKIRGYGNEAQQIPFDPDLVYKNTKEVLKNYKQIVDSIPEYERYNIFFTLGYTVGENPKDRIEAKWVAQDVFFFDIDRIDHSRRDEYIKIFEEVFKIPRTKFFSEVSGHGLHFFVALKKPIESLDYFKNNRLYFQVICSLVNDKLRAAGLEGEADQEVFSPKRLGRLPLTLNRKPGKPERKVEVLTENLEEVDLDLRIIAGLPEVKPTDHLPTKELSYFRIDQKSVLEGCEFIKYARESASTLSEPEWYAALSIVGRLPDGNTLAHEISKEHPSYTQEGTERKLKQALKSSGPRTCDNIESMYPGCKDCKHFKKVKSPVQIKGEKFIATKDSGFMIYNTKKQSFVPQYRDLLLHFEEENPFIFVPERRKPFIWDGKQWNPWAKEQIQEYAQEKFTAQFIQQNVANEFWSLIQRTNVKPHEFFTNPELQGKINLKNGVYDLEADRLLPHNPELGFQTTLPYEYIPGALAPEFMSMLDAITCNDPELKNIHQEWFGYTLSGCDSKAQKMFVGLGEGQNGKSTEFSILRAMVGPRFFKTTFSGLDKEPTLANFESKDMLLFEEVPRIADKKTWELLKDLSAGGDISASHKYENAITFPMRAKIVLLCNRLPEGATPSWGFFRRLLLVPFNATFSHGKADPNLSKRIIESELPGILNWALEGYRRLKSQNFQFSKSKASTALFEDYKENADPVQGFLNEHLELGVPEKTGVFTVVSGTGELVIPLKLLYSKFKEEHEEEGRYAVGLSEFTSRFRSWVLTRTSGPSTWILNANKDWICDAGQQKVRLTRVRYNQERSVCLLGMKEIQEITPERVPC